MIHEFDPASISGTHNIGSKGAERIKKSNIFRDLSTVWVTPTKDHALDDQVVFQSWMSLAKAPNAKFAQWCIANAEVADAYNAAVDVILHDKTPWKYLLTVETDNLPPVDGLLKLYESVDKYDVVGGLYWMKGDNGTPHIYGNPDEPGTWAPQVPLEDTVQPCNMLAMGFTLFNMDLFRKLPGPWFKTSGPEDGVNQYTQDGWFFKRLFDNKIPYKAACDTRVKVGHIDFETRKIW
jgi:hypothetical protein